MTDLYDRDTVSLPKRFVREPALGHTLRRAKVRHRVLIVGSNPAQTLMLRRALEVDDYDVVDCPSGRDAVLGLIETPADLLLINLPLSDGSATALVRWLRTRPATAHLPCFVIAAPAERATMAELYDAGADLVITRPTELDLLTRKVAAALARRAPAFVA
jgi:DNA-binding response OmpR family regulator